MHFLAIRNKQTFKSFKPQAQLEVNLGEIEGVKFYLNFSQYNFEKLIQTL